jgi:hypothetical protein
MPNLDGFVLYDSRLRLVIEFPAGWKEKLKTSSANIHSVSSD